MEKAPQPGTTEDNATHTRGSRDAYERYLRGMDASMRQKVALTAAHLLCTGKVADMGMGSGAGSDALSALYPMLTVVGVDLDETMVTMAAERFKRPNLSFIQGDIAADIFAPSTLDGIFDSSVLHHVTSFGAYEYARAAACLENQARALKPHGVLVVRDFLAPSDDEGSLVALDLPSNDGDDSDDPRSASSANLFVRFAREFRSLHSSPGFRFEEDASANPAIRTFRTTRRIATEFVLRKDYRADWESEVKEEYTYFTQTEFEALFARLGFRILASTPIRNPWIVRARFAGKFEQRDANGARLTWPATNYVIAGEKVREGEGVSFREASPCEPLGFLKLDHYRDTRDGSVRDLVRRPHASIDVVPYFDLGGDLFVVARMSYPRPILSSGAKASALDESTAPHYVTEPLNVLQTDKPLGQTVEEMLSAHASIEARKIRGFRSAGTYYPSPGGSQEEVRAVLVEVDPILVQEDIPNVSGFSTSGRIRALEAEQVLRAAQVGGLPDARLELNVYDLFAKLGRTPGPWIGESIAIDKPSAITEQASLGQFARRPSRRVFERASRGASAGFLELRASLFQERDGKGAVAAEGKLEYVVPSRLSTNTIVCALLARVGSNLCIGVDDDDLPASQCFVGNSELLVAPAWRVPKGKTDISEARDWTAAQLKREYDLVLGEMWELGGAYYPSAGMSPEVAFPIAFEVASQGEHGRKLYWIPIDEVGANLDRFADGHLRLVALRAAHALGRLGA